METRNSALGFVYRTRKNLEFLRKARTMDEDVHLVAHLINSLLGLVVLPMERHPKDPMWTVSLEELQEWNWPNWIIIQDEKGEASNTTWTPTKSLGRLITHLRNAAAHGKFVFADNPESRNLSDIRVIVEDAPFNKPTNWRAEIGGEELYQFCLLLTDYIQHHLKPNP
ncbi:MAG: HEPN family nuclease [Chloroflexi bacterium]|nr:HEPN family nuclease [Chloroflexota bacterium]